MKREQLARGSSQVSVLKLHLVAPEAIHGEGERQGRDMVGPAIGVPGHLLPYRNAVGAQFGNVEPEVGGWIGVQTSQGFLELSPHTMSVPTLPVNPGAGIEDQALVEIAPVPAPRLLQSLVAVPEATRSVKL